VLLIGNSYTYFNNLPEVLATIARDARMQILVTMYAPGGATLREHLADPSMLERLRATPWDYVVIQEQSTLGLRQIEGRATIADPEFFLRHAQRMAAEVRATGAKPMFLLTWKRRDAPVDDQHRLTHAYVTAASRSGASLIPAGPAWERVRRERPDLELYASDGSHPGPAGTYLTAHAILAAIIGRRADAATVRIEGHPVNAAGLVADTMTALVALSSGDAQYLASAAWEELRAVRSAAWRAPATPEKRPLPPMPSGNAVRPSDIQGHWAGPFAFFRPTGTLTLKLCSGRSGGADSVEIDFGGRSTLRGAARNVRVEAGVLRFAFGGDSVLRQEVRFWGRMAGDSLAGVGEFREEGAISRAVWRVGRVAHGGSGGSEGCVGAERPRDSGYVGNRLS
jgi:hypothetical protein